MADAAVTSGLPASEGVNPNKDVGGEGKYENRANSTPTFADMDDAEVEQKPRRRIVTPEKRSQPKDVDEPKAEKAKPKEEKAKPEPKEAKAKPEPKEGEEKEEQDGETNPEQKPVAKKHRFKNGDQAGELQGDVVFAIPVDGKKEDVPLQELINNYNGKKKWDVELNKVKTERETFGKEREDFSKERDDLNNFASELVKKSAEDPDSAVDFLAELTKQDPVELKEKMLRQHIAEILPLARLNEQQLEQYIREKKLDWRDANHKRRDSREQEERQLSESQQKRQSLAQKYAIDDDQYSHLEKHVRAYLKGADPKPEQVVEASRRIMAAQAVQNAAPHLANHAEFSKIMNSVLSDLLNDPSITQPRLEALLKEVWGEEDEETQRPLRGVAQRAAKNAQIDDSETPSPERGRSTASRKAALFSDL